MNIIEICQYLTIKVANGVGLLFAFVWIPVLLFVLYKLMEWGSEWTKKTKIVIRTILIVLSIPGYVTYVNWIWPSDNLNARPNDPTNIFWHNFIESPSEFRNKKPPTRVNLPVEIRRYELISWNPPKHFYVTLEDLKTQNVIKDLHVSKHCNSADLLKAGEEYNIQVQPYTLSNSPNVIFYEFKDLYSVFCS